MTETHLSDETLSAWMEHELPVAACPAIEEHLRSCERCRSELRALRNVVQVAQHAPAPWAGKTEVWRLVAASISSSRLAPRRRTRLRGAGVRMTVVALAAALAGMVLLPARSRESGAAPEGAAVAALLNLDRDLRREVEVLASRRDWGTAAARRTLLDVNAEITGGIEMIALAIRARPDDAALSQSLSRAVEHRRNLLGEVAR